MSAETPPNNRFSMKGWVIASTLGWLLGFVGIIIAAVAVDMLGLGNTQLMIGVAMGAGVGFMQARQARPWLGAGGPWIRASVIGMTIPFLVSEIVSGFMSGYAYSLVLCVAAGSIMVGVMQRRLLQPHSDNANLWIPACVVGWTLPTLGGSGAMTGPVGGVVTLVMIVFGGVVLGVVTGWALGRILRQEVG